jgi:hypothetical protein
MSWNIFKQNVSRVMNNPDSINDTETIANLFATEYDSAIRRGGDTVNKVAIKKGNTQAMEQIFNISLKNGLNSKQPYSLINEMGRGVVLYWSGALLNEFPIPIVPAVGAIVNIAVTSNIVISSGVFPFAPPLPPVNSTDLIIDNFILYATIHLTTVNGIVNTISSYPPTGTPAPGVVLWTGYVVP